MRYNPEEINIEVREMRLQELIFRLLGSEKIYNENSWDVEVKSRLIESILIRIPLHEFWIDATRAEEWLIVDGLKRLSTVMQFMEYRILELCELEYLRELEGKIFDDLERRYQRRIEDTRVRIYLIKPGTPDEVKRNIIERIKT
jgi:hypothetical protein